MRINVVVSICPHVVVSMGINVVVSICPHVVESMGINVQRWKQFIYYLMKLLLTCFLSSMSCTVVFPHIVANNYINIKSGICS